MKTPYFDVGIILKPYYPVLIDAMILMTVSHHALRK